MTSPHAVGATVAGLLVICAPPALAQPADPPPVAAPAAVPAAPDPAVPDPGERAALLEIADAAADAELIEISDTAPAESASSVHLSQDDLKYRSRTQVSDILRQVPGLMVSQHA